MTQTQPPRMIIDARGLNCPLPVLRLRKRLKDVEPGAEVELLATDRAALHDVPAFCEAQGHGLTSKIEEPGGTLRFRVCKGPKIA